MADGSTPDTSGAALPADSGTAIQTLKSLGYTPPVDHSSDMAQNIRDYGQAASDREAAVEPLRQEQNRTIDSGVSAVHKKYDAIEPLDVKEWTAKPPEWDALQQYGSFASIMGQLAAQFTSMPVRNSLNAAAAAMRAQRSNDIYGYEQAHAAWKDNTQLAIDRHNIMAKDYEDGLSLLQTDITAGNAKIQNTAAKFGDKMVSSLAAAGEWAKLDQVINARNTAAAQVAQTMPALNKDAEHQKFLLASPDYQSGTSEGIAKAEQQWVEATSPQYLKAGLTGTNKPEYIALAAAQAQYPASHNGEEMPANEIADFLMKFRAQAASRASSPDALAREALYQKGVAQFKTGHDGRDPDFDEDIEIRRKATTTAKDAAANTRAAAVQDRLSALDQENARYKQAQLDLANRKFDSDADRRKAELDEKTRHNGEMEKAGAARASMSLSNVRSGAIQAGLDEIRQGKDGQPGHEPTYAEQNNVIQQTLKGGVTGNRADDLARRIDLLDDSTNYIDRSVESLDKYIGVAGAPGYVGRGLERIGDILGKGGTDRVQFMRDLNYLQLMAPTLFLDRGGKPLSAEGGQIQKIIGGLSLDSTTANTLRSLQEVRALYQKSRADASNRMRGTWDNDRNPPPSLNSSGGSGGSTAQQPTTPDWSAFIPAEEQR